ncbi:MAG: SMC-Scp complex subunit ScpB, partial [Acidobacteriota bacterium]
SVSSAAWDRRARARLSQAALETLAIIAYRQPVTLPEINFLRGVNSAGVIRTLLERRLVRVAGRKQVVGTPLLYRTTREFLVHFGLDDLSGLPAPAEVGLGEVEEGAVGP